jgi:hypothetical protein
VLLAAIVRAGDPKIIGVAQDFVAVGVEPVEQVDVLASFAFPAPARVVVGVGGPPGIDELALAPPVTHQQFRVQRFGDQFAGRDRGPVDLEQQLI